MSSQPVTASSSGTVRPAWAAVCSAPRASSPLVVTRASGRGRGCRRAPRADRRRGSAYSCAAGGSTRRWRGSRSTWPVGTAGPYPDGSTSRVGTLPAGSCPGCRVPRTWRGGRPARVPPSRGPGDGRQADPGVTPGALGREHLLFRELADGPAARGTSATLFVVGRAAKSLASDARRSTHDMDAPFEPSREVRAVAGRRWLDGDWLDDGAKGSGQGRPGCVADAGQSVAAGGAGGRRAPARGDDPGGARRAGLRPTSEGCTASSG